MVKAYWRQARALCAMTLSTLALSTIGMGSASAQPVATESTCTARGYTVAFFNGVWNTNTQDSALSSLNALKALHGKTYKQEPVQYTLFYNNTGSTVGATGAQDVAEVFIQRALEFDQSGELGKRFEYFWEVISGGDRSLFERMTGAYAGAAMIVDGLYTSLATKALAGWSYILSDPPTSVNYAEHRLQLDTIAARGQKLLMVAHSQGNLFVNPAYDYVKTKVDPSAIAVVHIAPASMTTRGDYTLAGIDVVINALRTQGLFSVPLANLNIAPSTRDLSGHTLVDTYLDPARDGRARVASMMTTGMEQLVTPTAVVRHGFFTAMLTWDGAGDVDLHTFEPSGAHVFYSSKAGTSGYLDLDNTEAEGPEHYYATCDPAQLATGTYQVGINNFARAAGRTATVQISFAQGGQPLTRVVDVGPVRGPAGNNTPIQLFNVTVSKDQNGKFAAAATPI